MTDARRFRRFILYPRAFPTGSNVLDPDALFSFIETERDAVWEMSLTAEDEMPDDDEAHGHGCLAAKKQNDKFMAKEGRPPDDEKERVHYLGFYVLHKWALTSSHLEWLNCALYPIPEDGNNAHYALLLFPIRGVAGSNKKRRNDMRKVRFFLRQCMMGPTRYSCPSDTSVIDWLEGIVMPVVPHRSLDDLQAELAA